MKQKIDRNKINRLRKGFKSYSDQYNKYRELDKATQKKVTHHLIDIESENSVLIERDVEHCPA